MPVGEEHEVLGATDTCAVHPARAAAFLCPRCGDFGCEECAHRVTPGAQPLCPSCWSQRSEVLRELQDEERRVRGRVWLLVAVVLAAWVGLVVLRIADFL